MVVESEAEGGVGTSADSDAAGDRGAVDGLIYARMSHEIVAVPDQLLNIPIVLVNATDPDRGLLLGRARRAPNRTYCAADT